MKPINNVNADGVTSTSLLLSAAACPNPEKNAGSHSASDMICLLTNITLMIVAPTKLKKLTAKRLDPLFSESLNIMLRLVEHSIANAEISYHLLLYLPSNIT